MIVVEDQNGKNEIVTSGTASSIGTAVNGKNAVVYWSESTVVDEKTVHYLCISKYDESKDSWSEGMPILTEEGNIGGVSMILLDDENIAATYFKEREGKVDFCYKVTNFVVTKLYLDEEYAEFAPKSNGSVAMTIPYGNFGTKASNGFDLKVYSNDAEGLMIGEGSVNKVIESDEQGEITVLIMPQEDTDKLYLVMEDSEGKQYTALVDYRSVVLGMDTIYDSYTPGSYDIDLNITNSGVTAAQNVIVEIHKDSTDGEVVAQKHITALESFEKQHLHIEIPKEMIFFTDGLTACYVTAYEEGREEEMIFESVLMYKPDDVEITETYEGNARDLSICISNQKAFIKDVETENGYRISKNGKDILTTEKWTKQASLDTFKLAVVDAEIVLKMVDAADEDYDKALFALEVARNNFEASFKKGSLIPATDISVTPSPVTMLPGKTQKLTVKLTSTLAKKHTDSVVSYTSSDENVAKVSGKGIITAVSEGEADIAVTLMSGLTESIHVYVQKTVRVTSLNKQEVTLIPNKTFQLKGSVIPAVKGVTFKYVSYNDSVATVDNKGNIKGVGAGTTMIVVTPVTKDSEFDYATAFCTVTVLEGLDEVLLDESEIILGLDSAMDPASSQIVVADADKDVLTFTSSKSKIASVDANGLVTAKAAGSANITIKTLGGKKATCKVTVVQYAKTLSVNTTSLNMLNDTTVKLKATTTPKKNKDEVIFESNDPSVAIVDATGKITAMGEGSTTITVKTKHSEIEKVVYVTVSNAVSKIEITGKARKLLTGKAMKLSAKLIPSGTGEKITWSSDNESIATVDNKGTIKGVSAGLVHITAQSDNGAKAVYGLTIVNGATKLTLNVKSANLAINNDATPERIKLVPTIEGTDTTDTVTYKTSNKKVAMVTSTGLVVAKGKGKATITATTVSGKKTTCKITVKEYATGVHVDTNNVTLKAKKSVTLKATAYSGSITDNRVSNKKVIWKLVDDEDAKYIKIGKNGKITALQTKKARIAIRAYAADGSDVYSTTYVVIR